MTPTATFRGSQLSKWPPSEGRGTLSDMSHGGGTTSFPTPLTSSSSSLSSLSNLRGLIASAEHTLYTQLAETSLDSLSDVRRAFMSSASDTFQRLCQFTPPGSDRSLQMVVATLPDWWSKDAHCLPNSGVIVRESEWGSIISFTLRSIFRHCAIVLV
jgi:1-phosphatidylinositol-3-phosphate 5-kinase